MGGRRTGLGEQLAALDGYILLSQQAVRSYAGLLARPVHGFRWATSVEYEPSPIFRQRRSSPVTLWLIPAIGPEEHPGLYDEQRYPVLTDRRCRDMHRQFARLATAKPTQRQEAIRRFAGRFGFLGAKSERVILQPRDARSQSNLDWPPGEPFQTWDAESCEAAALVALWDLVRAENRGEVAKYVVVTSRPRRIEVFLAWNDGHLTTDRRLAVDWRVPTFSSDLKEAEEVADERTSLGFYRLQVFPHLAGPKPDVLAAARLFLFDRINCKLWGRVSPQLRAERQTGEQLLYLPHSLLGAIYLYFVQELEGRSAPGTLCANPKCDRLIDASWNRKYCDDRCKDQARYYRDYAKRRMSRRTRFKTL